MPGSIGLLLNGNMLVGVWKDSLAARFGADVYEHPALDPLVKQFDIQGKPMRVWLLVEWKEKR